jgi:hypothetical protein
MLLWRPLCWSRPTFAPNKELYCKSDIMRVQYLDGFKAIAEASESIHTRERRKNERGQVVKRTPLVRWSQAGCLMEVTWNMVKRNSLFSNSLMSWRQWVFYFRKFFYTKHANKEQALLDGFRKDKAFSTTSGEAVQFKMALNFGVWSGMGCARRYFRCSVSDVSGNSSLITWILILKRL